MKKLRLCSVVGIIALVSSACAHQVVDTSAHGAPSSAPSQAPVAMTVALGLRAFEGNALDGDAILEHFVAELKGERLFQGVMYPIPPGADPVWELQLLGRGHDLEPNSNFWKAFFASALFPLAFVFHMRNDYTLELQAILVRNQEIVRTYTTESSVQYSYQINANQTLMRVEGAEILVGNAIRDLLAQIRKDRAAILIENGD